LGGASSDAAATLVAANIAWRLGWSIQRLMELAGELGSDIPFFLSRGAAVCRGRGEQIESTRPPRIHVVVVRPPVGLSTPQVYKACRPADSPASVEIVMQSLLQGDTKRAGRQLHNRLQPAAETLTPWIGRLREEFGKQDVVGHQMSGSGSSYFGLCRSARHARRIAARLRARDVGTVLAATSSVA
jgi:4-diphosphocytidyl-2-C-methyl-D-erythritol kinase